MEAGSGPLCGKKCPSHQLLVLTLLQCPYSPHVRLSYSVRTAPMCDSLTVSVQPPCATLLQCPYSPHVRLSYSVRTAPMCDSLTVSVQPPCAITCINVCVQVKNPKHWQQNHCLDTQIPNTGSNTIVWTHKNTAHTDKNG